MYLGRQIPSSLVLLGRRRRRRRRRHFFTLGVSDIFTSIAPSFPSSISRKRSPPLFVPKAQSVTLFHNKRDALPKEEEEEEEDKTKPLSLFKVSFASPQTLNRL